MQPDDVFSAQSGADAQPRPAVDLAALREGHNSDGRLRPRCWRDGLPWPCDTMRLLTEVEWLRASPNYATYACQACGRRDGLDAVLPSTVWERIANGQTLLCLWCMDARAKAAGVELTSVSLHFIGLALCGTSQSQADQEHISRLAADLEQCRQQLAARDRLVRVLKAMVAGSPAIQAQMEQARIAAETGEWDTIEEMEARLDAAQQEPATSAEGSE